MLYFWIFLIFIPLADEFIKMKIRESVAVGCEIGTFIPFLKITYLKNFGAALGMLSGKKMFLIFSAIFIILIFFYAIFIKKNKNTLFVISAAFIMGGGIGNLIDRCAQGYVTDYLKLTFFAPVCNISDYFVSVGAVLLIWYMLKNNN